MPRPLMFRQICRLGTPPRDIQAVWRPFARSCPTDQANPTVPARFHPPPHFSPLIYCGVCFYSYFFFFCEIKKKNPLDLNLPPPMFSCVVGGGGETRGGTVGFA